MDQFIHSLFELPGVFWAGVGIQLGLILFALLFLALPNAVVSAKGSRFRRSSKFVGFIFVALAFSWSFVLGSATVIFERHNIL